MKSQRYNYVKQSGQFLEHNQYSTNISNIIITIIIIIIIIISIKWHLGDITSRMEIWRALQTSSQRTTTTRENYFKINI